MDYLQAIKQTKEIERFINQNNLYYKQKIINEQIGHYNYIVEKIKYQKIINIGLKELKLNGYNYLEIVKQVKSYNAKKRRISKRIKKMNKENIWFCTYTIEDKYIKKNHNRKLKEINKGLNYIINVDYGKQNNRKHYHGIIESIEKPKNWKYGYCQFKKIKYINEKALAEYINKLTNHTIKETAEKIIYSRN